MIDGPTGENPFNLPENTLPELEGSDTIHTDETILPQEPIMNSLGKKYHPDLGHHISVVALRLGKHIAKLAVKERGEIETPNTRKQLKPQNPISNN